MTLWCGIVTLFPEMFRALSGFGITRRAVERGLLQLQYWNPRDFASDKHQTVDDRPYGGGPGMVMGVYPLRDAIRAARVVAEARAAEGPVKVVYLSPQGVTLDQARIYKALTESERFVFIAGRYEGVDERLLMLEVDEEWSIGDYILSGGELAAMVAIDALTRLIPGALGHAESAASDSFSAGLLECPQYTRPEVVDGLAVPEVLLGGNHALIAKWRLKQSLGRTYLRRPALLQGLNLSAEQQVLLEEYIRGKK